jgi:hypothetical protein
VTGFDDIERIALLNDHAARHDEVGTFEVLLGQFLHVSIEEAHVPLGRKQRGHRYEAEGRGGGSPTDRLASSAKIEERIRDEARVNHEDVARAPANHDRSRPQ